MKITIKTTQFQDLAARAIKGSSNDKLIPITSLMKIRFDGGKLYLTTTDATNYLTVSAQVEDKGTLNVVVMADNFAKLISKMTCENITLDFTDNSLTVIGGRSQYKLELPLDVDGQLVELGVPYDIAISGVEPEYVSVSAINTMVNTAKSALATSLDTPCYTAYYVGDTILSTDSYKICCINNKLFAEPVLLSANTVDLLQLLPGVDETEIEYYRDGDILAFRTENNILYTKAYEGIGSYSVDAIMGLVSSDFTNDCVVRKDELLQSLDRLALFVGDYDRNVILMSFGNGELVLQNRKSAGTETIECLSGSKEEFSCAIDIEMLKSQVKANTVDDVEIQYGLSNCIKIVDGSVTQIIALVNV